MNEKDKKEKIQIRNFGIKTNKNLYELNSVQNTIKIFITNNSEDNINILFGIFWNDLNNVSIYSGIFYMGCIVWV